MNTAAAVKPVEPTPLVPVLLEPDRVTREGEAFPHSPPGWIYLPSAELFDLFFKTPEAFLRKHGDTILPYMKLRIIDDFSTLYTEALVLGVRAQAGYIHHIEIIELIERKRLRPAVPRVEVNGYAVQHRGPKLGWVLVYGDPVRGEVIRKDRMKSEAEATEFMHREMRNAALARR